MHPHLNWFMELSYPKTFVPRNKSSMWNFRLLELSFPGTFVPWNLRSQELLSNGTFVPKSKISMELLFPDTDNYWTLYPYVVLIVQRIKLQFCVIQVRWFLSHLKGQNMASIPLKNAHFLTTIYSTPNYPCKKFSSMTQHLSIIHPLRTERQTDGQQW